MHDNDFPEELAVRVRNVGKTYHLGVINRQTLRDELIYRWLRLRGRDPRHSMGRIGSGELEDPGRFDALDDVSFDIHRGETVGLIGRNGAGKSTMLKILARITTPTRGEAWIRGRVGSMLEVGTGFHPELTGRENIYLNGTILGMTRKEIDAKFDEIVEFSEIGDFLDTPVKRYSSGMYVKLAFSVASSLDNDVLLLDEVLAVGDAAFRKKSLARMKDIADSGRTILFVSHTMGNIRDICSRCLWFDHGRLRMDGPTDPVSKAYEDNPEDPRPTEFRAIVSETECDTPPNGQLQFVSVELLDANGRPANPRCGEYMKIRISLDAKKDIKGVHLSVILRDSAGRMVFSAPSFLTLDEFSLHVGRHIAELSIEKVPFTAGYYTIGLLAAVEGETVAIVKKALQTRVEDGDYFGRGRTLPEHLRGKIVLTDHRWAIQ